MTDTLWTIAGLWWAAWVVQSLLAVMLVRKLARRFTKPQNPRYDEHRPPAALIVPFKGHEPQLDQHLDALCTQNYPDYALVLVVESQDDPAYPALIAATQRHPERTIDIVTSGTADAHTGQKVHNHLAALAHLEERKRGEAVWAFADSDAVPGPNWLGRLVGPLRNYNSTAVSTGYRWMIPQPDESGRVSFASHLASILNSSAAGFLGRDQQNHAWGGSMAIPAATARRLDLAGWWRGALSDDYQISRMARAADLKIRFVPRCLVASPASFTWPQLREFVRRQYLITRTHVPRVYFGAVALLGFYAVSFWSALIVALWMLATRDALWREPGFIMPALALLATTAADVVRAGYRRRAIRRAFDEPTARRLRTTLRIDRWLTPLWMTAHLGLALTAAFGRTITWRGKTYRINAPQDIQQLN